MKKNLLLLLCSSLVLSSILCGCSSNTKQAKQNLKNYESEILESKEIQSTEQSTEITSQVEESKPGTKEYVLNEFKSAIQNENWEQALKLTNIEDTTFYQVDDLERFIKSLDESYEFNTTLNSTNNYVIDMSDAVITNLEVSIPKLTGVKLNNGELTDKYLKTETVEVFVYTIPYLPNVEEIELTYSSQTLGNFKSNIKVDNSETQNATFILSTEDTISLVLDAKNMLNKLFTEYEKSSKEEIDNVLNCFVAENAVESTFELLKYKMNSQYNYVSGIIEHNSYDINIEELNLEENTEAILLKDDTVKLNLRAIKTYKDDKSKVGEIFKTDVRSWLILTKTSEGLKIYNIDDSEHEIIEYMDYSR